MGSTSPPSMALREPRVSRKPPAHLSVGLFWGWLVFCVSAAHCMASRKLGKLIEEVLASVCIGGRAEPCESLKQKEHSVLAILSLFKRLILDSSWILCIDLYFLTNCIQIPSAWLLSFSVEAGEGRGTLLPEASASWALLWAQPCSSGTCYVKADAVLPSWSCVMTFIQKVILIKSKVTHW